jgi:integrase
MEGFGAVSLAFALERKYPQASRQWGWQYVFPARKGSIAQRSGTPYRHHTDEQTWQDTIKRAVRAAKNVPPESCHTLRQSVATHWLEAGYNKSTKIPRDWKIRK